MVTRIVSLAKIGTVLGARWEEWSPGWRTGPIVLKSNELSPKSSEKPILPAPPAGRIATGGGQGAARQVVEMETAKGRMDGKSEKSGKGNYGCRLLLQDAANQLTLRA